MFGILILGIAIMLDDRIMQSRYIRLNTGILVANACSAMRLHAWSPASDLQSLHFSQIQKQLSALPRLPGPLTHCNHGFYRHSFTCGGRPQ
jgi:hypothetical protein